MGQQPSGLQASGVSASRGQNVPPTKTPSLSPTSSVYLGQKTPQTSSASTILTPGSSVAQNTPQTSSAPLSPIPNSGLGQNIPQKSTSSLAPNPFGTSPFGARSPGTYEKSLFGQPVGTTNQYGNGTSTSDSKTTGGGLIGQRASPWGSKIDGGGFGGLGPKEGFRSYSTAGGGFSFLDRSGSTDGFASKTTGDSLFGGSSLPLGAKSDIGGFGSNTAGGGFSAVGGMFGSNGTTALPRASTLFREAPSQPNQTDSSSDANKGNAK